MHVVGARFTNLESANAALAEIQSRVAVPRGDVAVRPLGSTRYEEPATDLLLAGRFGRQDVGTVIGIVEQHGGALLSQRIEWPHPSLADGGASPSQGSMRVQQARSGERHGAPPADRHAARPPRGASPTKPGVARRRLRRPAALTRARAARDRRFSG